MRALALTIAAALYSPCGAAVAQVTIGPHGIRSGDTVIDGSGVRTGQASVTGRGVHTRQGAGTVILTNGGSRSVDCGGRALTVNGNRNRLQARRCSAIVVNGNGNDLAANFSAPGGLSLLGNRNQVRWHAARGVRVSVSNLGTGNSVNRN